MKTLKDQMNHRRWSSILMKTMLAAMVAGVVSIYSCQKTDDVIPSATQTVQSGSMSAEGTGVANLPYCPNCITASGQLVGKRITTYQYGSYELIVQGQDNRYALRSSRFNLEKFVDKNVEVSGYFIKGYPVDGGPYFIEVLGIRELTAATPDVISAKGRVETNVNGSQFASYSLIGGGEFPTYLLQSSTIDLGTFIHKKVEIKGTVIKGSNDAASVKVNVTWIKELGESAETVTLTGQLIAVGQGTYEYKYGWKYRMIIPGTPSPYYLKSSNINLDGYVNDIVKVTGVLASFIPADAPRQDSNNDNRWVVMNYYINVNWIMEISAHGQDPLTN